MPKKAKSRNRSMLPAGWISAKKTGFHIRTQPNKRAESLHVVNGGDRLSYMGETKNGWNLVQVPNTDVLGWISTMAGEAHVVEPKFFKVKKTTYIRAGAGCKTKSLGVVEPGTELLDQDMELDGYMLVMYNNQNGWVSKKAVEAVK